MWACPNCKFAIEGDLNQPRAYMYSIFVMLGTIFGLFAAVAGLLVYVARHEKQALEAEGYHHLFHNGVNAASLALNW